MKNKIIVIFAVLINILFIAGCGKNVTTYTYDVKNIKHCDSLYITKTKYYDDRVEITFNTKSLDSYSFNWNTSSTEFKKRGNTLIIYSDDPSAINYVQATSGWLQVYFRYLDSDSYATLWSHWADDLGWDGEEGDRDKYYTPEEKRAQAEAEKQRQEDMKKAKQESDEILAMLLGKWVSDDGSYFYIADEIDTGSYLLNYEAGKKDWEEYTEGPDVSFSWVSEDEKRLKMFFGSPYGWGAYWELEAVLSEDNKSFEYNSKTYYLADEESWGNVDIEYVHPVNILFENADEWIVSGEFTGVDSLDGEEAEIDETEETDTTGSVDKSGAICRYAVTDLDMNGCPEVIVSGRDTDGNGFLNIYDTTEDGSFEELKTNDTLIQPDLYEAEELGYICLPNKYQDVYKYVVEGRKDYDGEGYYLQNYQMSIQISSVVLEKVCSEESIEGEDGQTVTYYNDDGSELSSKNYFSILGSTREEAGKTASLLWFDEVTIENMAKSLGVFLESMNIEEE